MKRIYGISTLVFILAETVAAPPPASGGETWGFTNSQDAAVAPYAFWTSVHVSTNSGVLTVSDITGHGFDMTNNLPQSRWPLLNGSSFQCNGTNTLGFFGYGGSGGLNGVAINNAAVNISPPFYWFTVMAITNQGIPTGQDAIDSQLGSTESAFVVYEPAYATNQLNIETWEFTGLTTFQNIVTNHFMLYELDFLGNASSTAYTNGVQGGVGNAGANTCSNLTIGSFWDMSHFSAQFSFVGLAVYTNMTTNARSNITYFIMNQFNLANRVVDPVLTVTSSIPNNGVAVTVSPNDITGVGSGSTPFAVEYNSGTVVTLTAPTSGGGNQFLEWDRDGVFYSSATATQVTLDGNHTMTAVYGPDQCGQAIALAAGVPFVMNTSGATSAGDPTPGCQQNFGSGVWFKFTPGCSGTVTISTCGSDFNTALQVYSGGCTALTPVVCDDDGGPACTGANASVQFFGAASTTYWILVGGSAGNTGNLSIVANTVCARTLTVASVNPNSGVAVTVSPNDNNGAGNGTTSFALAYNDGTVVTLTAPATVNGNNFQKWQKDGADYSSSASTSVTMDADHTLTAVYVNPGGTAYYVTGKTLGTPRNIYSGFVGMKITVGANPVTVTALGRLCVSGNTATHIVKLVNAVGGLDVTGGSVSVAMSGGTAGAFTYAPLSSPVVLAAGTSYYVVSQETSGGDQYYGDDTTVTTTTVATEVSRVFGPGGGAWNAWGGAGQTYGPVDFQYLSGAVVCTLTVGSATPNSGVPITVSPNDTTGAGNGTTAFSRLYNNGTGVTLTAPATANGNNFQKWQKDGADYSSSASTYVTMDADHTLTAVYVNPGGTAYSYYVTGKTPGTPRNSYSGFVGMKITVGANPVTVTALGRLCVPGNTGTHTVKLVNAVGGLDVTGGSVSVAMIGGTAGAFNYATLSSPVVLAAGTSYYVVSQETSGGDQYYGDDTTVTTTTVATEVSRVFGPGGGAWNAWGGAGQTYGPVDFQYASGAVAAAVVYLRKPSDELNVNIVVEGVLSADRVLVIPVPREPGKRYSVESSEDLYEWRPLGNVVISDQDLEIRDSNLAGAQQQFYRLVPIAEGREVEPLRNGPQVSQ